MSSQNPGCCEAPPAGLGPNPCWETSIQKQRDLPQDTASGQGCPSEVSWALPSALLSTPARRPPLRPGLVHPHPHPGPCCPALRTTRSCRQHRDGVIECPRFLAYPRHPPGLTQPQAAPIWLRQACFGAKSWEAAWRCLWEPRVGALLIGTCSLNNDCRWASVTVVSGQNAPPPPPPRTSVRPDRDPGRAGQRCTHLQRRKRRLCGVRTVTPR